MRARQDIILIVNVKGCRIPVWNRGMTRRAIRWNGKRNVIWVYTLCVIAVVTSKALCWGALIPGCMALEAIDYGVCARQWKVCSVMVEVDIPFSCWMAGKTGRAVVNITIDAGMLFVCLYGHVTGCAGKLWPITRRGMTIRALSPLALV